jgi:hypothetical protein
MTPALRFAVNMVGGAISDIVEWQPLAMAWRDVPGKRWSTIEVFVQLLSYSGSRCCDPPGLMGEGDRKIELNVSETA